MKQVKSDYKICIIGLGYVGLPLASRFSIKGFDVVGFDINESRIKQLNKIIDINDDIKKNDIKELVKNSKITCNPSDLFDRNIFIVTVPTPINKDKTPDLSYLISSSKLIGSVMRNDSIVIYESTVYPGVTDDICSPILEEESGLFLNQNFSIGYSPERVVPGDTNNTIEKIKKIVSGSNPKALKIISYLYSSIIDAGIHVAPSIKVAEAAKVTENIQRDVNIALINEMHQLYSSIGINTNEVIDAASTKWNFMKIMPGLVGGHCISIDPYYLMHKSEISGYQPMLMSTARDINDKMSSWAVNKFLQFSKRKQIDLSNVAITLLGYTFKENCSDTRNTKVKDIIVLLQNAGLEIEIWDPCLEIKEQENLRNKGVKVYKNKPEKVQIAFVCVYHDEILKFLEKYDGIIFDFKKINS